MPSIQDLSPSRVRALHGANNQDHRFYLQQGPIDLIIDLFGTEKAIICAESNARFRFSTILHELVNELPALRQTTSAQNSFNGVTASRMWRATSKFGAEFITPMAAVAGAVADEILMNMQGLPGLHRALVNNGGDIALWGLPGETFTIGLNCDLTSALKQPITGTVSFDASCGINGVATSGWRGRSQSLGIADSVTVFAESAALADAAATMIANHVNVDSPCVLRKPANELFPDSDLGSQLITTDVLQLSRNEISSALDFGKSYANKLQSQSLIAGAILALAGHYEIVGCLDRYPPNLSVLKYDVKGRA